MAITLNGTTGEVFPSWTTAGRPASPVAGQSGFNSTNNQLETYNGTRWVSAGAAATGAGNDNVFVLNGQSVSTTYSVPSGNSAMSTGPITVNSGVVVTVPTGSKWVVL